MDYFKGKAIPKGATHFCEGAFYKKNGGNWLFFSGIGWLSSVEFSKVGFCEASLMEIPIYTPEPGEECEATWGVKNIWCLAMVAGKFLFVKGDDGWKRRLISNMSEVEFRPLKPEAEKQADAMHDMVKDAADLYAACEILVENGYKK